MRTGDIDAVISQLIAADNNAAIKALLREIEVQHTDKKYKLPRVDTNKLRIFRKLYAEMLYEKEVAAAKELLALADEFAFYKMGDYERRARFEYGTASILLDRNVRSIAYIGSGPFPATAIFAARNGMEVILVDRSEEALSLSQEVVLKCGVACRHMLAEAERLKGLIGVDLIVVSGTVGIEEYEKLAICRSLMQGIGEDSLLCVRSPVREEALLMAPTPTLEGSYLADAYIETGTDYMNRTFLAKHPRTMKGWI